MPQDLTNDQMRAVQEAFELFDFNGNIEEYQAGFRAGYKAGESEGMMRALKIINAVRSRAK